MHGMDQSPLDATALARGREAFKSKQFREAFQHFTAAMADETTRAEAFKWRGITAQELGDVAQALEDCRQAVALAPEDHHAHLCLGHMHFASGDYCAAEESYNTALELNPGDAYYRGRLAYTREKRAAKEAADQEASARCAAQQACDQGVEAYCRGQYQEAFDLFTAATMHSSTQATALKRRCLAAMKLGRLDQAMADGRAAVALAPQDPVAHSCLGRVLYQRGRYKSAKDCFEAASQLDPSNTKYREQLEAANKASGSAGTAGGRAPLLGLRARAAAATAAR